MEDKICGKIIRLRGISSFGQLKKFRNIIFLSAFTILRLAFTKMLKLLSAADEWGARKSEMQGDGETIIITL